MDFAGARPVEERKGADRGIDGRLFFHDEPKRSKQVIFSVKSGSVGVAHVRDLRRVLDRENAEIGALFTLQPPTQAMRAEAASAGFYKSPSGKSYPRIQIRTISELLEGKSIELPPAQARVDTTFKKAPKAKGPKVENHKLPF